MVDRKLTSFLQKLKRWEDLKELFHLFNNVINTSSYFKMIFEKSFLQIRDALKWPWSVDLLWKIELYNVWMYKTRLDLSNFLLHNFFKKQECTEKIYKIYFETPFKWRGSITLISEKFYFYGILSEVLTSKLFLQHAFFACYVGLIPNFELVQSFFF